MSCPRPTRSIILGTLDERRAADVLEAMDPDDAADLLAELSNVDRNRLLELMEPDEAEPVRQLLKYSEDTAGGMMTSEPVILSPDATIAEALARVREPELTPSLASQVYVCRPPSATPTGRYLGLAHIQRLLREPPSSLVSGVLDDLEPLRPEAPLAEVTRYFATYNLVAAPGGRRPGPAGRRGQRRRRARPPAARRLARAGPPWLTASGSTSPAGGPAASASFLRLNPDAVGHFAEGIARFLGTGRFLAVQTIIVVVWITLNVVAVNLRWDPYPFILLNLAFSTQAAYAAPLILLAQNRQADRDRVQAEEDRARAASIRADTEYLARELASLRVAVGELATRDFIRDQLGRLTPEDGDGEGRKKEKKKRDPVT